MYTKLSKNPEHNRKMIPLILDALQISKAYGLNEDVHITCWVMASIDPRVKGSFAIILARGS